MREAAYQKKVAQLQIGPKKFTEVSEVKVPLQSPIDLLKSLVEGACKGERKRKKEACTAHLPSGRRQLTESADSGRRSRSKLALHSQITQPLDTLVVPLATTC